ncbi:MAG: hypothetical protein K2H86_09580 [Muribaculaceae bacterium]|nr:hypothetical protein [Muribaculaceae bacterium]
MKYISGVIRSLLSLVMSLVSIGVWGQSVSGMMVSMAPLAYQEAVEDGVSHAPLHVTAEDLMTKAYGVSECSLDSTSSIAKVIAVLGMTPQEDEYGQWLDSADGYRVNYGGMCPEVSAMANYDNGTLEDMAFFFIFPYAEGEREWANVNQARFCGCLLQEMSDMGLELGADSDVLSPLYFDVDTSHENHPVNVKLREYDGAYVLALHVGGFGE